MSPSGYSSKVIASKWPFSPFLPKSNFSPNYLLFSFRTYVSGSNYVLSNKIIAHCLSFLLCLQGRALCCPLGRSGPAWSSHMCPSPTALSLPAWNLSGLSFCLFVLSQVGKKGFISKALRDFLPSLPVSVGMRSVTFNILCTLERLFFALSAAGI